MKAKTILVAKDNGFSRDNMEKILERGNNQNVQRSNKIRSYASFQQRIFVALILFLLTLFIIRISAAQGSFSKIGKSNLGMEGQEVCLESLSPSLTGEQVKILERLQRTYKAEAMPIRTELLALRVELRYLLSDPMVQPQTLFDHQRKISALQAQLEGLSLSSLVKARSVFTKEQLKQFPQGWAFQMGLGHEFPVMDSGRRFKKGLH